MKKIIFFATALFFAMPMETYGASMGKITLKVINEDGKPIEGATAFISYSKPGLGGIGIADILKKGSSDKDGLFSAESSTINSVGLSAEKDGYYHSSIHYEFKSSSFLLNRWEPWNPTIEVVLKKKRNQVPMIVTGTGDSKVPTFDKPVGYDLEKGDWVAPYGGGLISDFIFTFSSVDRAWRDYDCSYSLTFAHEKDGIQEYKFDSESQSSYKWPFDAPVNGYISTLRKEKHNSEKKGITSNVKENLNYIFRVRSKTDKQGNIVEAKYGKIEGEIDLWPGKIKFRYFFNPDGTRNLEEDPNKNLFKNK